MRRRGGSEQPVKGQRASRARKVSIAAPSTADLQDQVGTLARELKEALERQTAMAEVLQVINASPGNPAPMFETLLDHATRLCGAQYGILWLGNRDGMVAAALRNVPTAYANYLKQAAHQFSLNTAVGQALATLRPVQVDDVRAGVSTDPMRRATVDLGGARTLLTVPMLRKDQIVGVLAIFRQEVRPFDEAQIRLVTTFADQAVIAIENARLLTEQREALEQQAATAEVLGVINSSPGDLGPVFDAVMDKALTLCDASLGQLLTFDGDRFRAVAWRAYEPGSTGTKPTQGMALYQLIQGEQVVHIADITADDIYRSGNAVRRRLADKYGARTAIWVALRKEASLLGALVIYRTEVRPFTDKQIALLQNFSAQAVIAMENARLLGELRERTDQVAELNRGLEARVAEQVDELGRVGRLKRFLAPQLAELIVSQGDEKILESHRREIVVVFCDLRGYTAFAEAAEPEEVLDFLREYHGALGPLVSQFEGTLDQFSGDGIMVFFNDPVPIPDPAERAVKMAVAMREAASTLIAAWRERGRELGFGAGIAQGYATLGQIGFSERSGYTAIGTVCNVAARLCGEAKDGQILLSQRVNVALKGSLATEQVGALALKGLTQPVVAYNVPLTASQPTLRVDDGGNH